MLRVKWCAVLCLILFSSGCSVKFAYNNVDRLVRWQVNEYLTLDAAQKEFLQQEVKILMAWHRREHLPLYANYLGELSLTMTDGVSESQIAAMFDQFIVWGEDIQMRVMPPTITLMTMLSDEQLRALPEKLEEDNRDLEKDELDTPLAKIQANWAKDFEEVMERFTGRLQREQTAYLRKRAAAYQPERVLWADYRRRRQADMLALLERRYEGEAFAAEFTALALASEDYYGEAYSTVSEQNILLSREIAAHLFSTLTEKQSKRLRESLENLSEDFSELARQSS